MDRRNFLSLAAMALAGQAAERVWPFRVYSIPKNIVIAQPGEILTGDLTEIAPTVKAMRLHVYSPDFEINRGSFLATMNGGTVIGNIPDGIMPGDVLVSEVHGPLQHSPITFLNLARLPYPVFTS